MLEMDDATILALEQGRELQINYCVRLFQDETLPDELTWDSTIVIAGNVQFWGALIAGLDLSTEHGRVINRMLRTLIHFSDE